MANDIGPDVIVLDTESRRSADDCRWCSLPREEHLAGVMICQRQPVAEPAQPLVYTPLGWKSKPALGLSIGMYFSYRDQSMQWFDEWTLAATMQRFVDDQSFLISFNGLGYDFVVMRGLLRQRAESLLRTGDPGDQAAGERLNALCDAYKALVETGYDILASVWSSDPASKRVRGINSLAAFCEANGLPQKAGDSALIPGLWRAGHVATVANHCRDDVLCTRALFETVMRDGQLQRLHYAPVTLPRPLRMPPAWWGPILAGQGESVR